jgi:methylthioribose-1-phosphate isomerase
MARTLWIDDDGLPATWDQTLLPFERRVVVLADETVCARAIATMQVRGAPLIGAVGAWGLALALRRRADDAALDEALAVLAATRPTAVNLRWALERVRTAVRSLPPSARAVAARAEAIRVCDEDVACNAAIGRHGATLLAPLAQPGRALQLLTHCNAGRLATLDHGTALAPVYALHEAGVPLHVWVDETRPRNQGASLTAWELGERGVPHTVIADNAGGQLMREGRVDAVIVGCDRVAMNGDVANKIGTYLKALAARDNRVPFIVACPVSTIDPLAPDGAAIPIEARDPAEVASIRGRAPDGRVLDLRLLPEGSPAFNPAFDVTPARLVDSLLTEHGPCAAQPEALARLLARSRA